MIRRCPCVIAVFIAALAFSASRSFAQTPPTEAQIKRDLMNPGVVEIIIRGRGSFEKFVENRAVVNEYYRSVTVRRKTDQRGITVDVLGDVVYRLIGGRWVFRKMRLAGNTYGGINNPTLTELNQLVGTLKPSDLDNIWQDFIGEIESIKIWSFPNWEWHTPNSVSFNVVLIHSIKSSGATNTSNESAYPDVFVDRVERIQRWRIYRDGAGQPWKSMTWTKASRIRDYIKNDKGESIEMMKILARKKFTVEQVDSMPRPTKVPPMTE